MNGRIQRNEPAATMILPRIGKIKIGKKSERGFPQSVDYFIPSGKYAGLFTQAYGERPQTIQIVFPDDDAEKVCNEFYEYRDNEGRLLAKGDGAVFQVWNGEKYVELNTTDYPHLMDSIKAKYPSKQGWRIRLTMNFIVPMVKGIAGLWTFETNGTASTIPQVRDTFDTMLRERSFVKGIIFDLNVQFATSQHPGAKSKFPVVTLVANESAENVERIKNAYNLKSLNQ